MRRAVSTTMLRVAVLALGLGCSDARPHRPSRALAPKEDAKQAKLHAALAAVPRSAKRTGICDGANAEECLGKGSWGDWESMDELFGDENGDRAGQSVSISDSGAQVVFRMPGWVDPPCAEAFGDDAQECKIGALKAYEFDYTNQVWIQKGQTIPGAGHHSHFADSTVSISGDGETLAYGMPAGDFNGILRAGGVRVFNYNKDSSMWVQMGTDHHLAGNQFDEETGWTVSLNNDGRVVALGLPNEDVNKTANDEAGVVRIYHFADDAWTQKGQSLSGPSLQLPHAGESVSIDASGDIVAYGVTGGGGNGMEGLGAVRVFKYERTTKKNRRDRQKLYGPAAHNVMNIDPEGEWVQTGSDLVGSVKYNSAGSSIVLSQDGKTVAFGGMGRLEVHSLCDPDEGCKEGENAYGWKQKGNVIGEYATFDGAGDFTISMSDDASTVAYAVPNNERKNGIGDWDSAGSVRVFRYNTDSKIWDQKGELVGTEANDMAYSGGGVSLDRYGDCMGVGYTQRSYCEGKEYEGTGAMWNEDPDNLGQRHQPGKDPEHDEHHHEGQPSDGGTDHTGETPDTTEGTESDDGEPVRGKKSKHASSKKRARGSKGVASLLALERRNGRKDAGKDPRRARNQLRKKFDCDSGDGKGVVRVFCWIPQIAPPPNPPAPPPAPPSPNPPPSPAPLSPSATQWTFTGSWSPTYELGTSGTGKEIGTCTEEWNPPVDRCQTVLPATTSPGDDACPPGEPVAAGMTCPSGGGCPTVDGQVMCPGEFSILGSDNNVVTGQLTILGGRTSAWSEIRFEGAQVLSVDISPGFDDSNPLMPKLVREQAWAWVETGTASGLCSDDVPPSCDHFSTLTVEDAHIPATSAANSDLMDTVPWIITVTVDVGNQKNVNAHFGLEHASPSPPPSPESPSPLPPAPKAPPAAPPPASPPPPMPPSPPGMTLDVTPLTCDPPKDPCAPRRRSNTPPYPPTSPLPSAQNSTLAPHDAHRLPSSHAGDPFEVDYFSNDPIPVFEAKVLEACKLSVGAKCETEDGCPDECPPPTDERMMCAAAEGSGLEDVPVGPGGAMSDYDLEGCDGKLTAIELWSITGSWAIEDGPISCTNEWSKEGEVKGGEDCSIHKQPYEHPGQLTGGSEFSIAGSHNAFSVGKITIVSGQSSGWDKMEFSGAEVLTVAVHHAGAETGALAGTYDPATQAFTVDDPDETASLVEPYDAVSWVVTITVPDGNLDDVNVHFETVSYMPPPAPPPPSPAPNPSPSPGPSMPPPMPAMPPAPPAQPSPPAEKHEIVPLTCDPPAEEGEDCPSYPVECFPNDPVEVCEEKIEAACIESGEAGCLPAGEQRVVCVDPETKEAHQLTQGELMEDCDGDISFLPLWTITGSWSIEDGPVSCTEDWALPKDAADGNGYQCENYRQPYEHPGQLTGGAEFTISGSSNVFTTGKISIASGQSSGWSKLKFSGANVLNANIHHAGAETGALEGVYDPATQSFTVENPEETASLVEPYDSVSWMVTITVPEGNVDDVNVHFETVSYMPPPAPPPPAPAPSPSPGPAMPPPPPMPPAISYNIDITDCGKECEDICTPEQIAAGPDFKEIDAQCTSTIAEFKEQVKQAIAAQCSSSDSSAAHRAEQIADMRLAFDSVALTDDDRSMDDYNLCTDDTIITVLQPWEFTGSWGDVASPTCTESQGPSGCVQSYPATAAPGLEGVGAEFTVTGSTNYNGSGVLTILSGQHSGWSQVAFTGGCAVKSAETEPGWDIVGDPTADENELSGAFDVATQTWSVALDDVEDTTAARPMYQPIPWELHVVLEDDECTEGVNAHFTILKFNPPPPSASPPPSPAPPPVVSVHGDPMFKSHGSGTHFWLAAGRISPLLLWRSPEGASMRLSGKTFHSSDAKNQWFDQFVVTQDGVTVLDVAVKENAVDARQLGNTIDIKVDGKPVDKKGASPKASLLFQSAKAALKATMSKRGDGFADNVETTAGGLALAIYSSKADKFDTPKMAKKYMHLNIKFAGGLPKDASGIFTELAGNKPVSLATKALLKAPPGKVGHGLAKGAKKTSVWKPPAKPMESL